MIFYCYFLASCAVSENFFIRNVLQRADKLLIFTQKIVYTAAKEKPTQRAHNKSLSLGEPPHPLTHRADAADPLLS